MPINMRSADGEAATLATYEGQFVTLLMARAYAPGQPLSFEVTLDETFSIPMKCSNSRRQPDGRFEVRARILSIKKTERAQLEAAFSASR